jgi:hypothetical protein
VKETKFIELLNLYIDRQISPEAAAALETEILNDPRRRQIYREYCRMQRACTLAFETMGAQAAEPAADRVRELAARPRRPVWGYYAAGLAAAACVVLVAQAILRPGRTSNPGPFVTVPTGNPAASQASLVATPVRLRVDADARPAPLLTESRTNPRLFTLSPAEFKGFTPLAIANPPPANAAPLALPVKATFDVSRPSIDQFVFEASPPIANPAPIYRAPQQTGQPSAMSAYQFQR